MKMTKKYKLTQLLSEQGIFAALKSLINPVSDAISQLDLPDTKEDADRTEEWNEIQTQIQQFYSDFPQFTPKTEKELASFEKWLKSNKRQLTRNNVKERLTRAYMGKETNVDFAKEIQKMLVALSEAYKDDIFKGTRADELEKIVKDALIASKGNIEKAKHSLLKFMLDRFNKIASWKLGNRYKGKEGVENPIEYNSNFIGKALDLSPQYVASRIKEKIAAMQKIAGQEKEEQLKLGPIGEKLLAQVVDEYTKKHGEKKNKELLAKLRDIVIKTIRNNPYHNLEKQDDFNELVKISLETASKRIKPTGKEEGTTDEEKESKDKLFDTVIRVYASKRKLDKNNTEVMNKIRKIVDETIDKNIDLDLEDRVDFKQLAKLILKKMAGGGIQTKKESRLTAYSKGIIDLVKQTLNNPNIGSETEKTLLNTTRNMLNKAQEEKKIDIATQEMGDVVKALGGTDFLTKIKDEVK